MFRPITEEFLREEYIISTSSKLVSLSPKIWAVASKAGGMQSSFLTRPSWTDLSKIFESGFSHKESVSNKGEQTGELNWVFLDDGIDDGGDTDEDDCNAFEVLGDVERLFVLVDKDVSEGRPPKENKDKRLFPAVACEGGEPPSGWLWWKMAIEVRMNR